MRTSPVRIRAGWLLECGDDAIPDVSRAEQVSLACECVTSLSAAPGWWVDGSVALDKPRMRRGKEANEG